MKPQSIEKRQMNEARKLDKLLSTSGLLLSIVCCIALIHVEFRMQEHHRRILQSATDCDQIETEIIRKVHQNYERWQVNKGSRPKVQEQGDATSRQKRAQANNLQSKSAHTAAEVKLLIKEELRLLQNHICVQNEKLCRSGPKGNSGRRGRPGTRGRLGPEGTPGKHGPIGPQGPMGIKGDPRVPGDPGPTGPRGPLGEKGAKGEPGQSISAPSLLQRPVETTVNESQTAILKCTVDGNPRLKVTWSKQNSSLPVGRHVVESSGALIVRDARPEDEGVYNCRAENLLGSVNHSAKLIVHFHPQLLLSSTRLMAEEGQNVTILCNTSGQLQPKVTWSKAVGSSKKERTTVIRGALTIYEMTRSDGGTYICKAQNILGLVSGTALLMVFSPLRFKVRPQEVTPVTFSSTVRLPCVAESDLRPKITWTRDKSSLPVDFFVLQNGTLVIQNIKKSHQGSYICRAANAVAAIETEVKISSPVAATSCSVIRKYVSSVSGNYVIDPDGEGGLASFSVYCDMVAKNGVGVTVISHDSESRTYILRQNRLRDIHYTGASLSQLGSLTRVSSDCEQFIKYECYRSFMGLVRQVSWWMSRDSIKMSYWGGASPGSGKCACGMTNSCANPSRSCNCDKNDNVWREDSGLLTDKTKLPVKQLYFGDVGEIERGYHTLGKLKCYGTA